MCLPHDWRCARGDELCGLQLTCRGLLSVMWRCRESGVTSPRPTVTDALSASISVLSSYSTFGTTSPSAAQSHGTLPFTSPGTDTGAGIGPEPRFSFASLLSDLPDDGHFDDGQSCLTTSVCGAASVSPVAAGGESRIDVVMASTDGDSGVGVSGQRVASHGRGVAAAVPTSPAKSGRQRGFVRVGSESRLSGGSDDCGVGVGLGGPTGVSPASSTTRTNISCSRLPRTSLALGSGRRLVAVEAPVVRCRAIQRRRSDAVPAVPVGVSAAAVAVAAVVGPCALVGSDETVGMVVGPWYLTPC